MSDFHGEIETAYDLSRALAACGCCPPTHCLEPILECQSQELGLCYFSKIDMLPDDSDSDSRSEECRTYWREYKHGSTASITRSDIGMLGAVFSEMSHTWNLIRTVKLPKMWTPFHTSCEQQITCVVDGNYSLTENFIQYVDDDPTRNGRPTSYRGPFPRKTVVGTLTNMAGQLDPTLDSSDIDRLLSDSGGNLDPSDLLLPTPCAPIWKYVTTWYDAIIGSESDNDGHLLGSVIRVSETTYAKDGFSETTSPNSDSDGIDHIREWKDQITCDSARLELPSLGDELWYAETEDSDSRTQDEIDEDMLGQCEANYRCTPCGHPPQARRLRYRWRVPPCHPGSYYRIDWDEIFFPKAYLDWLADADALTSENLDSNGDMKPFYPLENPPPARPEITPKSWVWTGAALGDCPTRDDMSESFSESDFRDLYEREYEKRMKDPARRSPWSSTVYAAGIGLTELRNIRVQCFRSPFGTKPQLVGIYDQYDPEDIDQDGVKDADERRLDEPESSSEA